MRFVHVPVAEFGGFVIVLTEVDAQRDIAALQRIVEAEIRRSIVHRIAAEDHQHFDFATLHVDDQFF